jgi:copper transport protein
MRRALTTAAIAGGLLVGLAAPAAAHARPVSTSPGSGSTVHGNLTRVSVTFDEAVDLVPHALRMTTDRGVPVNLETARLSSGGKVLSANVQDHLASGGYIVAWRVQADDGHLESATFTFSVAAAGAAAQPTGAGATAPAPAPPSPGEPLWPVLVAAAIALVGGLGAGIAVRRGLRLAAGQDGYPAEYTASQGDHESLRLPM